MKNSLTDIPGIRVGHWTNVEAGTGCTVIICSREDGSGAVAGVDVRGGAPGTREIALLDPVCTVEQVHALLLSGGSAFGLAAADGVMRWLEERKIGFDVGVAKVPIVPAAILFDLAIGRADVRPDANAGYAACEAASDSAVSEGNVGAGTGATVGKMLGFMQATQGGLGTASLKVGKDIVVSAVVAVNAVGEVFDPSTQETIAGARKPAGDGFVDSVKYTTNRIGQTFQDLDNRNTTIAVVATNAKLTKVGATKVSQMAHDGLARTIRPIHTMSDGDAIFTLSLGEEEADPGLIGMVAADVLAESVIRAVRAAETLHGIPAARDL